MESYSTGVRRQSPRTCRAALPPCGRTDPVPGQRGGSSAKGTTAQVRRFEEAITDQVVSRMKQSHGRTPMNPFANHGDDTDHLGLSGSLWAKGLYALQILDKLDNSRLGDPHLGSCLCALLYFCELDQGRCLCTMHILGELDFPKLIDPNGDQSAFASCGSLVNLTILDSVTHIAHPRCACSVVTSHICSRIGRRLGRADCQNTVNRTDNSTFNCSRTSR